jgi:diguanylate cyclase (GGDEF)-like protein
MPTSGDTRSASRNSWPIADVAAERVRPFRSLTSTLIRSIIAAGAVCAIGVAALQVLLTYRVERDKFQTEVQTIVETSVPLLSVSVWDIEPDAIRRQMRLIAQRPQIAHARLETGTGQEFESGVAASRGARGTVTIEIPYPSGKPGRLGTLAVTPNTAHLRSELFVDVLRVLLGCVVLTALVCAVVFVIVRRQLEQLRRIAAFASSLTPADLTRPLALGRAPRRWRDEIDEVAEGFGVLQTGIRRHVEELDRKVAERTAELRQVNAQLEMLARRDPLTGLANRRRFEHEKARAWAGLLDKRRPLALMMIDIDHFKRYNDHYGHAAGDECLAAIGRTLGVEFHRPGELAVRLGGEEFAVMLQDATLAVALERAEALRTAIEALERPHAESPHGRVTVSIGVAGIDAHEIAPAAALTADAGIGELLKRADEALYSAKARGRNVAAAYGRGAVAPQCAA